MNFIIRHLEALGDEVAAALDDLAEEVVGRKSDADRRRTPDLSDAESSPAGTTTRGGTNSDGMPSTDDESVTDTEGFTGPSPPPQPGAAARAPAAPKPMGTSTVEPPKPISVKRRALVATRVSPPPPSAPQLHALSSSVASPADNSPLYSPVQRMPEKPGDDSRHSPCLDDIGEAFVERSSRNIMLAPGAASSSSTRSAPAEEGRPVVAGAGPAEIRQAGDSAHGLNTKLATHHTGDSAPAIPKKQSLTVGQSDFDLCENTESPKGSAAVVEGEYIVL